MFGERPGVCRQEQFQPLGNYKGFAPDWLCRQSAPHPCDNVQKLPSPSGYADLRSGPIGARVWLDQPPIKCNFRSGAIACKFQRARPWMEAPTGTTRAVRDPESWRRIRWKGTK